MSGRRPRSSSGCLSEGSFPTNPLIPKEGMSGAPRRVFPPLTLSQVSKTARPGGARLTLENSYEGRTAGLLDKAWVFTLRWNLNLKGEDHGTRDHPRRTVRHQF